jgi:lysine 6-dehydrogenase
MYERETQTQVIVLGAGMVGSAIARDLAQEPHVEVVAVDLDQQALDRLRLAAPVRGIRANLREKGSVAALVAESDLVVCAVPGFMGYETLERVIQAGKDVVDISFFDQDPFLLDELAQTKGVIAVVDCGVAPGLCNVLAGHVQSLLDHVDRYVCYVGGLPRERRWPYEYQAVFSPVDVLEEYTRPARLVEYGREVVRPALSDVELRDFPGIGTLEAFNTDGLRTLCRTLKAPFMQEKTLRYPGHASLMRVLRESGFFDTTPIEVEGTPVRPIALTSRLLFEQWKLREGDQDLTVMQVIVEGRKGEQRYTYQYDLFDRYDPETRTTSMARTTGYTCAIVARQVAGGLLARKGICPPEFIGRAEDCYRDLLAGYARRDIHLSETISPHVCQAAGPQPQKEA